MLSYAAAQDAPVLLGTELGLVWGAAFEKREGRLVRACVLGPVHRLDLCEARRRSFGGRTAARRSRGASPHLERRRRSGRRPVFFSDTSVRQIKDGLASYQGSEVSIAWKSRFIQSLAQVRNVHIHAPFVFIITESKLLFNKEEFICVPLHCSTPAGPL